MLMSDQNQYQTPTSRVDVQTGQAYSEVKVFSAKGRMGRVRFINFYLLLPFVIMLGLFVLFAIIAAVIFPMMLDPDGAGGGGDFSVISSLLTLAMLGIYIVYIVYSFLVLIQRCHDFNASGWLSLVMLIPVVGIFFLIAVLVIPGTEGENNFGAQTKPNSTASVVFAIVSPIVLVAVIGIVAAISIPAYQDFINRAQLLESELQR